MQLPDPSDEQQAIIDSLEENNVIANCCAGSGKTTSILYIASHFTEKNILLLTYNAKLKLETREKVQLLGLTNVEIHSYHSFAVKYYDHSCFTDSAMIEMLARNSEKLRDFAYDLIVLDEAQDMTPLYYSLICNIVRDNDVNSNDIKLCVLGDRYQSIYEFNEADERFIIYADRLFNFNSLPWIALPLAHSFRITHEMSEFINNCMLHHPRILSDKVVGYKPKYVITNCFGTYPYDEVMRYLTQGYKLNDMFILAPSVRSSQSPTRRLANKLSKKGYPVFIPNSDEEKLDPDVLQDKIVFSTYFQVKGLERKVIIVFGFDNSYFKFYNKDANPNVCPNTHYVATTRAIEHLTLFHHNKNDFLPYLNEDLIHIYCEYSEHRRLSIYDTDSSEPIWTSATDLVRHLPARVVHNCMEKLNVFSVRQRSRWINVPIKTKQKYGWESVADITGTAIPTYYEYLITGEMTIFSELTKENKIMLNNKEIKLDALTEEQLLHIANLWQCHESGYKYKLNQIQNYTWLSKENLDKCVTRLKKLGLSNLASFEQSVGVYGRKELLGKGIKGFVDCVDADSVYELKCVSEFSDEHFLQLAIYMYIIKATRVVENENDSTQDMNYYLYNILTNELVRISCSFDNLKDIVRSLIYEKYMNHSEQSDEEFIARMNYIRNTHLNNTPVMDMHCTHDSFIIPEN